MTDWNEAAATTPPVEDPIGNAAERGIEHLKAIAMDLIKAGRSAAQSVLDEEKESAARQVGGIAAAVRSAAQSLDHADLPTLARYAGEAAGNIESFGHALSRRGWGELADDVEILARRQPALFLAAVAVAGFLAGRLVRASGNRAAAAKREQVSPAQAVARASEAAAAAISSAPGAEGWTASVAGMSGAQDRPQ